MMVAQLRQFSRRLPSETGVVLAILALFSYFSLASPVFFDGNNLLNIGRQIALLAVAAFAMTFIILSGEIDLSVGAVAALIGILLAMALRSEYPIPVALLIALGAGISAGAINGFITAYLRVPSFIVTLGMFSVARGIAFAITNQRAISVSNEDFLYAFAGAEPLGIAVSVWYVAATLLALNFLLTRTSFGTHVYAVGGNMLAARLSGIPARRMKLLIFMLAGGLVGVGAILQTARVSTGFVDAGRNLELDAIAAVVLGGTSFTGGRGSLVRTVLGVLLIGILNNGLTLLNVQSYYQLVIKGAIIIIAVLLDRWTR
jgi:ribose/xylose/arabinose/galactoside ABC-type transport system permease subunit